MVAHITIILCQCQTGVNARLTGSHRHVGGIGDQNGTVHHGISGLGVDQLGEILQNLRHLVSSLTAADINDQICIRPFCDCVLSHGLTGTETAGDRRSAALCDREQGIQDTLSGYKRAGCRMSFLIRSGNTDRPFLGHGQLFYAVIL